MNETAAVQKVKIDPVGCFTQAFDLVKGQYWLLVGISAVGTLIAGAVPIVLMGPMMCGLYLCYLAKHRGEEIEFALLFKGFDHFLQGFIAGLIMTAVTMVIMMPFFIFFFAGTIFSVAAAEGQGDQVAAASAFASMGLMIGLGLAFLAVIVVVTMLFLFTFPLIVDRGLDGVAAITTSTKAVLQNFWGVLGLTALNAVLGLVGALACYIGTYFVLPISLGAMTIAYRRVFPEPS